MKIVIRNIPDDLPDQVVLESPTDPEHVQILHHESDNTESRFTLMRSQVFEIPERWPGGPVPVFPVLCEKCVDGHYWMTPHEARSLKRLVASVPTIQTRLQ